MATSRPEPPPFRATDSPPPKATPALVKDIVDGTQMLVRAELELARAELMEGVNAKAQAAGAGGAIAVLALYLVGFLGLAGAYGLGNVMPMWAACLVVAGVLLLLVVALALFARAKATSAPLAPEQTKIRIQEDVAWAKTLIRR